MKKKGIDPNSVAKSLTEIFSSMIFKHGFIHCDAHPGNIMVRKAVGKNLEKNYQIILLDHGLYRKVNKEFINNFAGLWLALVQSNRKQTE